MKRALCVLVIFALAVSIVPTTASASALTVVGTSFSSAGLTSAEFAASAGPYAIGILAAVAAAYGIKAFTKTETGQAVKEFFQGLIEKRAEATRRSVAEQMEALLGNATIDEEGNINLGRLSFAEAKATLLNEEIAATRPTEINKITLGNYEFNNALNYTYYYYLDTEENYNYRVYADSKTSLLNSMFFIDSSSRNQCIIYPERENNYVRWYIENINTGSINYHSNSGSGYVTIDGRKYIISMSGWSAYRTRQNAPMINLSELRGQTFELDDLRIDYANDTLYGVDETLRGQNVGLNEGLVLAPDLINSAVLGGASGQISASDYCGALVDYVSGYDTVIDGVTVTGLPEASTVPRTIDEAPTSDTVIDEAPPSTMTGTEAAGLYSFSLDELFPFCLPFDFVRIIEKFNVEPEAPNFDWRFYIPGVIDYTLHIDLSAWNTAAEVCRTMVLIAFMVGLIMLTRQIFIRA